MKKTIIALLLACALSLNLAGTALADEGSDGHWEYDPDWGPQWVEDEPETPPDKPPVTPDDPNIPDTPDTPDVPSWPDTPTTPSTPGSSGNSGSSSSDNTKPATTAEPTISTVTDPSTGNVITTTIYPDGSASVTTTTPDGMIGTVNTNASGMVTSVEASISASAAEESLRTGKAVKLPVVVSAARNSSSAPKIDIAVPDGVGRIKVEIPVSNVTPSTIAVIVHADGTEEIVKTSYVTENGVVMGVSGNVTVKIIDNSKNFADIANHWGESYIEFVTARELFNSVDEQNFTFAPDSNMTRAMLMVVLARLDGADTAVINGNWYDAGMNWSVANGISDGTRPNDNISREELVTMLYRYAGSPAATGSLKDFPDGGSVQSYALSAMTWAVETGVITGMDDGTLAPQSNATRAMLAAILTRFCQNIV